MAAGLGFKTFTTGEVLTAANVNGYLMQGVLVFADAAARDAAITSPQEGQFAYLKDTNVTTYYTGSAWANLDTTGMVNPMTTTGDTIYSSSGSTPARLAVGSTGQVLTVAGGVPTWSTPSTGAYTLLSTNTISSGVSSYSVSSISGSYKHLHIFFAGVFTSSDNVEINLRFNGISTTSYIFGGFSGANYSDNETTSIYSFGRGTTSTTERNKMHGDLFIPNYTTTGVVNCNIRTMTRTSGTANTANIINANFANAAAISQITLLPVSGTLSGGTITVYGVN